MKVRILTGLGMAAVGAGSRGDNDPVRDVVFVVHLFAGVDLEPETTLRAEDIFVASH